MIDMGLTAGAKSLWEGNLLCDYTIEVGAREFRVHKVVLASVSGYFRAMLGGSMKESSTDRVELKELSSEAVSTIIQLIYTGDESLIDGNDEELLRCSVYLQIQPVISACTDKLIALLDEENCLQMLSKFMMLGCQDETEKLKSFIKTNWISVFENAEPEDLSYEVFQVVFGLWKKSEFELFLFLKNWVNVDIENRQQYVNNLMAHVRFSLMARKELTRVKKCFIYKKANDSWKALVDEASRYHDLPMHLKVLEKSEQSTVRTDPTPVMFSSYVKEDQSVNFHGRIMHTPDDDYRWAIHLNDEKDVPYFKEEIERIIVVNNFLICCPSDREAENEKDRKWYIFDPRTRSWSVMPPPSYARRDFAMTHHEKHLYVLGGFGSAGCTSVVEVYSFESNSWRFATKMPIAIVNHSACVVGNVIYTSGGQVDPRLNSNSNGTWLRYREISKRFDRFNISSQTWESLPALLDAKADHHMYPMKISNKDVIVVCDKWNSGEDSVMLYDFLSNQWSYCQSISPDIFHAFFDYDPPGMSMGGVTKTTIFTYVKGNTVFSIHFVGSYAGPNERVFISKRWDIPENGGKPREVTFGRLILPRQFKVYGVKLFGGLLSMPPKTNPVI